MTPEGLRKFLRAYERALIGLPASEPRSLAASVKPAREAEAVDNEKTSEGPNAKTGLRRVFLQQLGRLLDALSQQAPYRTHLEIS